MKTLKSIQEWMDTNPSKEEVAKVLNLVNRGIITQMRREVYNSERDYNKLFNIQKRLDEIKIPVPKDITNNLKELRSKIDEMKKQLPTTVKREKKDSEK